MNTHRNASRHGPTSRRLGRSHEPAPSAGRIGHALGDLVGEALGAPAARAGRRRHAAGHDRHRRAPAVERLGTGAAVEAAPAVRAARAARGRTSVDGGIGHGEGTVTGMNVTLRDKHSAAHGFCTSAGRPMRPAKHVRAHAPPAPPAAPSRGPAPRPAGRRVWPAARGTHRPASPKTRCCAAPLLYNSPCFNRSQPELPPCPSPSTSRRSPPR